MEVETVETPLDLPLTICSMQLIKSTLPSVYWFIAMEEPDIHGRVDIH